VLDSVTGKRRTYHRPLCAWLLAAAGAATIVIGIYFIFIRPPLLPEDLRYIGMCSEGLLAATPKLVRRLELVFTVLGGYIVGAGVLLTHLALGAFAGRKPYAFLVAALGGGFTTGLMSVVNLVIDSDFKFVLFAITALWLGALICYVFKTRGPSGACLD
jgi:hypothetical protein